MFSLSRAIEEFSIRRQEKVLTKKFEAGRINALEHVFNVPMETLKGLFSNAIEDFKLDYPRVENLGSIGIEAFLVTLNVEINSFPPCLNLIKKGKKKSRTTILSKAASIPLWLMMMSLAVETFAFLRTMLSWSNRSQMRSMVHLPHGLSGMTLDPIPTIKEMSNIGLFMFGIPIGLA